MSYLKPPALTRKVVNPLVSRLHPGGVATLTVAGRVSGQPRSVPVIPVTVGGRRYLVAPYGESDWVRNLRAAGKGMLRSRGQPGSFHATEVPAEERAGILDAYRDVAGKTVERCFATLRIRRTIRSSASSRKRPAEQARRRRHDELHRGDDRVPLRRGKGIRRFQSGMSPSRTGSPNTGPLRGWNRLGWLLGLD